MMKQVLTVSINLTCCV